MRHLSTQLLLQAVTAAALMLAVSLYGIAGQSGAPADSGTSWRPATADEQRRWQVARLLEALQTPALSAGGGDGTSTSAVPALNSPTDPADGALVHSTIRAGSVGGTQPGAVSAVHGTDTGTAAPGSDLPLPTGEAHAGLDAAATASEAPTGAATPVGAGAPTN